MNVKEIAKGCNVSEQAVYKWMREGWPAKRAAQADVITGGDWSREELCPDVFDRQKVLAN